MWHASLTYYRTTQKHWMIGWVPHMRARWIHSLLLTWPTWHLRKLTRLGDRPALIALFMGRESPRAATVYLVPNSALIFPDFAGIAQLSSSLTTLDMNGKNRGWLTLANVMPCSELCDGV